MLMYVNMFVVVLLVNVFALELRSSRVLCRVTHILCCSLYIDIWECTYRSQKLKLLTMVDFSSKWAECAILKSATAPDIASALITHWCSRHSVPRSVLTDQDPAFIGEVLTSLSARLGIKQIRSAVYHPKGNSPVEGFHRTLRKGFAHFSMRKEASQLSIEEILHLILWSYRSVINLSTGESPAYLCYGVDLRPPKEGDWRWIRSVPDRDRVRFLSLMRLEMMTKAFLRQQRHLEKEAPKHRDMIFHEGDLILARVPDKRLHEIARVEGSVKLIPKWSLPHRVVSVSPSGKTAKVVNLLSQSSKLREVHISNARFINRPSDPHQREEWNDALDCELEKSAFDPADRTEILAKFWEAIDTPQAPPPSDPPSAKRPKSGLPFW